MTFPRVCGNVRGMGVSSRFNSNSSFPARVASAASQLLQPQTAAACLHGRRKQSQGLNSNRTESGLTRGPLSGR